MTSMYTLKPMTYLTNVWPLYWIVSSAGVDEGDQFCWCLLRDQNGVTGHGSICSLQCADLDKKVLQQSLPTLPCVVA